MLLTYQIFLRSEPEGGYSVSVPGIPGCHTQGDTVEEAFAMAKEAIELCIDTMRDEGEEIVDDAHSLHGYVQVDTDKIHTTKILPETDPFAFLNDEPDLYSRDDVINKPETNNTPHSK